MATYVNRTPSSASNRKTWTFSTWLKRSSITTDSVIFAAGSGTVEFTAYFKTGGTMEVYQYTSGTYNLRYETTAKYRDPSAWYHVVIACDTTQANASDRFKIYVNGSQVTDFNTSTAPSQNQDTSVNLDVPHLLGKYHSSSGGYFLGYLSQSILTDGTAYAASTFGSTDSNGVWIPNTGPSVTYGTNGFKLDYPGTGTSAGAGNFGADSSGNGNHFTGNSVGTNANVTDTPENNFATLNTASNYYANATISEGATKIQTHGANYTYNVATMGVSAGKWYVEAKVGAGINNWFGAGIAEGESSNSSGVLGRDTYYPAGNEYGQIGWFGNGTDFVYQNDGYYSGSTSDYDTNGYTTGDVISLALDADNNNVKFYKNGTVQNSGNAFTLGASSSGFWHFAFGDYDGQNAGSHIFQVNFGNPAFTIASSNADANGYGSFEYAVPSGYYALCTKNLAQYGG